MVLIFSSFYPVADILCIPPDGVRKSEVPPHRDKEAEDGVLVPHKNVDGVDPSVSVEADPNGVECSRDPDKLKGLVNGAGLVLMMGGGITEGGVLRVAQALGEVATVGNEDCCGWLAITGTVASAVGRTGGGTCNVGWTLLAAASCLAVSLLSASKKGSLQLPLCLRSLRY